MLCGEMVSMGQLSQKTDCFTRQPYHLPVLAVINLPAIRGVNFKVTEAEHNTKLLRLKFIFHN